MALRSRRSSYWFCPTRVLPTSAASFSSLLCVCIIVRCGLLQILRALLSHWNIGARTLVCIRCLCNPSKGMCSLESAVVTVRLQRQVCGSMCLPPVSVSHVNVHRVSSTRLQHVSSAVCLKSEFTTNIQIIYMLLTYYIGCGPLSIWLC